MRMTQWYVITGAPCSGKTTLIRELERMGHRVVHEAARAYIDSEMKKGRSIQDLKADIGAFEHHILKQKIALEAALEAEKPVFLDRAVPDSIAYYRLEGLPTVEPLHMSRMIRYKGIFLCQRLGLEADGVRVEDDAQAERLDRYLEDGYRLLGYAVLRVPRGSVAERLDFILQHL